MTTLDTYLRGPHREDTAFRQRLLKTIDEVIPIFYKRKRDVTVTPPPTGARSTWPYAAHATAVSGGAAVGEFSASTHGMILFALDSFTSRKPDLYTFLLGLGFRPCKLGGPFTSKKELAAVVKSAQDYLVEQVAKWDATTPVVVSGTYGNNDPFTLTWLVELAFRLTHLNPVPDAATLGLVVKAADVSLTRPTILDPVGTPAGSSRFNEVTGSFLKVRRLHLALATKRLAEALKVSVDEAKWPPRAVLWGEFDSTLHRQLSYHAMGDPKFDPAELTFAFEGALLLEPNWVGRAVGEQVFAALALKTDGQPFWRPVTPFLANDRGQVLFLVSVEVANSILRSCELLDRRNLVPEAFARIESHLRTYATWILGEAERIPDASGGTLVGWRSEYGEERGTIHLWHTSHVLLFLAHYECFLKRKIAADGVEAAGLSVRFPKKIEDYWKTAEPLPGMSSAGGPYAVFDRLRDHYLGPRTAGRIPNVHSVLMYGPPGTGKTTVAEQMAHSLGQPLVTVTVSDFLAAGSAELENRAKGVFKVLRSLEGVVILFDEIDQFLLDRNSEFYHKQSDVFKFMTPGMLNKFQDLRDDRDCVFLIATNYFERIDSAIKRRGRVDDHLLLSLPNKARRAAILREFVENAQKVLPKLVLKADFAALPGAADVLDKTVFFGWGDLKYLVESTAVANPGLDADTIGNALALAADGLQPAVNLPAYSVRFEGRGPYPSEEFFLMAYLVVESGRKFSDSDLEVIKQVAKVLKLTSANCDQYVKDKVVSDALKLELLPHLS